MRHAALLASLIGLTALWLASAPPARAQEPPRRFNIWDIHIGDLAGAIPDEYINFACGTNGGPPSLPLKGFTDFKRCRPDADGLREVYFAYDDELEYRARALDQKTEIRMYAGTTVFDFPIVASLLFDEDGRVRGERMVTDPRQHVSRDRVEFWELAGFLRHRFGDDGWTCEDLPLAEGERPVGSQLIKNRCRKQQDGLDLILSQSFFERKGQRLADAQTGAAQPEAFESMTRFEIYDATVHPDRSSRN